MKLYVLNDSLWDLLCGVFDAETTVGASKRNFKSKDKIDLHELCKFIYCVNQISTYL